MGQGTVAQMVAGNQQMTYMPAGGTELDMPYRGGDPIPLPNPNRLTGGRRRKTVRRKRKYSKKSRRR